MNEVYLLLGSNEGNRGLMLDTAAGAIEKTIGKIVKKSSIYETAAWGKEDQPSFLNQVVFVQTLLDTSGLLRATQSIETALMRQREVKWGQRTLDIDILFFNDAVIHTEQLRVPHPFLQERRFTLVPLKEIAPGLLHPVLHKTIEQLLAACPDPLEVRPASVA